MALLPPAEELSCFVGDSIAQISFDPHAVQFTFESMRRSIAEHRIVHVEPDGTAWHYDCRAAEGPPLILHRLLYRPIVSVEREEMHFTLVMDDGSALSLWTNEGPFESGLVADPEKGFASF